MESVSPGIKEGVVVGRSIFLLMIWIRKVSLGKARARRFFNCVLSMPLLGRRRWFWARAGLAFSCTKPSGMVLRPISIARRRPHSRVLLDRKWHRSCAQLWTTGRFRFVGDR